MVLSSGSCTDCHGALAVIGHPRFAVRGEELPAELLRAEDLRLEGMGKCYPGGSIAPGWGHSRIRHTGIQTGVLNTSWLHPEACDFCWFLEAFWSLR